MKWNLISSANDASITSRSSHTINFVNNKIYIFGGECVPRTPVDNKMLTFSLETKNWLFIEAQNKNKNEIPSPRIGHSSCILGNKIYIFGGRTGIEMGECSLNDLYEYDTVTDQWTLLDESNETTNIRPEKRSYHTMATIQNKIYVFGGCSAHHGRLNDLYEFDLTEKIWTKLNTDLNLVARGGSSLLACYSNGSACLYLIGGFCGHELNDFYEYNISKNSWNKLENLPQSRSVFASSIFSFENSNFRILIHGGEIEPTDQGHSGAGEFSTCTFIYDGLKWELLKFENQNDQPSSRGWHSGCNDDKGNFYIYGGNLENNQRTNELWCLHIK